jgi:hypothetical protein
MKIDFIDEITIVTDSKIDPMGSTNWKTNNEQIIVNYWLVQFANKLDSLNKMPVIEY